MCRGWKEASEKRPIIFEKSPLLASPMEGGMKSWKTTTHEKSTTSASSPVRSRGICLFGWNQSDHAEVHGEDTVVGGDAPCWAGMNIDMIFVALRKIRFDDE